MILEWGVQAALLKFTITMRKSFFIRSAINRYVTTQMH